MSDTPLASKFGPATPDSADSLFNGQSEITTTLTADMTDVEIETFFVEDATGAPFRGFAVIGDELIRYGERFGAQQVQTLTRGVVGAPASHVATDPVALYPLFAIPKAYQDSIIAMQSQLVGGVTGLFTTMDGKTVTITNGIVTAIA